MHLVGMTGSAGRNAGGKTMIRYGMYIGAACFEMKQVAVHAADSSLVVNGIWKVHRDFFVTVNAKRRRPGSLLPWNCLQCCRMRVVADSTRHSPLEMCTGLPVRNIETIAAVTASAQVAAPVNWNRIGDRVGRMCSRYWAMAGFAGNSICCPGSCRRVVPGHVTYQAGSGFTLVCPHLIKLGVADRVTMCT